MALRNRRTSSPQSVTRAIHILQALCISPQPASRAHISRVLNAPNTSIAGLLRGLVAAGFVVAADNGAYRLRPGAFGLSGLKSGSRLVDLVVRIGNDCGSRHPGPLLSELVVYLAAKSIPQMRYRGAELREPCSDKMAGRIARDDGGSLPIPKPVKAHR
jgi:hypothetical protein